MDPAYVAAYAELAEGHFWWRARRHIVARELARLGRADGSLRLLEVGCAGGANFPDLEPFGQVHGLEPEAALLPTQPDRAARVTHGALDEDFAPEQPFDRVLALDVLEHVDDRPAFLGHLTRLLAPRGAALLTVPALPSLWSTHDERNQHRLRFTRAGLVRELSAAGLEVTRCRYLFASLVPLRWLARGGDAAAPPRVPPGPPNRGAELWLRAEARLPLPFGTSLLALARRASDSGA